jgi:hypothetical protein
MSRCPRAIGGHAIEARARRPPRVVDSRRLRERTTTRFRRGGRSNSNGFGASWNSVHRRKRGRGRPSASKTTAEAKITSPNTQFSLVFRRRVHRGERWRPRCAIAKAAALERPKPIVDAIRCGAKLLIGTCATCAGPLTMVERIYVIGRMVDTWA